MTHDAKVLHGSIRHQETMFAVERRPFPGNALDQFEKDRSVFGMGSLDRMVYGHVGTRGAIYLVELVEFAAQE